MLTFKQFLYEQAKDIKIDRKQTDRSLQRQPTVKQATTRNPFLAIGGKIVGSFKSGKDNISVVHTPHAGQRSGKYTFHDTDNQHPIASLLYKKDKNGVIYNVDAATHSQYQNPRFLMHALGWLRGREKIKLRDDKLELTPEGKRLMDAAKRRGVVSENKLLDKPTKTLEQIAQKHKISIDKLSRELKMGMEIEHEHTTHSDVAREIALDHLDEVPDYYTRLKFVEKKH